MAAKKVSTGRATFTEQDGHALAADMLREIAEHWRTREKPTMSDDEISELWRRDDSTILRRYLATVRERRSPALERGFFAVLTDFIGSSPEAGSPNPEYYLLEHPHG